MENSSTEQLSGQPLHIVFNNFHKQTDKQSKHSTTELQQLLGLYYRVQEEQDVKQRPQR